MHMDIEQFKASLSDDTPPGGIDAALEALWRAAKGEWDSAHHLAQVRHDRAGAWVHAYLHRQEGDLANAGYWYSRAGREPSRLSLEGEWEEIATALLAGLDA